jgi:multiple sugar transport system substrate-binding protein
MLIVLFTAAGCGNDATNDSGPGNAAVAPDKTAEELAKPADMTLYVYNTGLSDTDFQQLFQEPLKTKFPNVTMKMIHSPKTGPLAPENIIAAGETPDLIMTGPVSIPVITKLNMGVDLNDAIKKANFDLTRFDQTLIESIRKFGDKGEFYGIPFYSNFPALFYNKSIFDKFAVSYPMEMITWEETYELARKLTRSDGGAQYYGFAPPAINYFGVQLALPYVNPQTNKAVLQTDQWANAFKLFKQFVEVPGILDDKGKLPVAKDAFTKDKTMAMLADWANGVIPSLEDAYNKGDNLDWDLTTYPSSSQAPGIGRNPSFGIFMLSAASKNQTLGFEIIKYFTSDEMQERFTEAGRMTALNNESLRKSFGKTYNSLKGKNINAALKSHPALFKNPTDYDDVVVTALDKAGAKIVGGQADVNTLLRETEDEANKAIAEQLAQ